MTGLVKAGVWAMAAALVVALPGAAAMAAALSPGGAVAATGAARPAGLTLLGSRVEAFSTFTGAGTLTSQVFRDDTSNPFGLDKLTFTYQLENTDADGVPSEFFGLTVASFAGFQTDVGFDSAVTATQVAPTVVQRGAGPGEQVAFSFLNPPLGGGAIAPGFSSAVLVVHTDAAGFADTVSSISGALAPNVDTLAPLAVPEPAGLVLIALGGVFLRRSRRGTSPRG